MSFNFTPHTEADARKASTRTLLKAGWCDARIIEATEKLAKSGKPMIENLVSVPDAEGNGERQLRDWLLPTSNLGALKFRHCCESVGALAQYEAGSIAAEDFPGNDVRVKIGIKKQRGYPDSNVIEDYAAPADSSVVNLRAR